MPASSDIAIWWVFVAGVLALAVILAGFVVALVISQRRVLRVEREHARQLLEAQEAERAWVAREVHDDVLQRVALLRAEVEDLQASSEPAERAAVGRKLGALVAELDDLSHVLRGVAHRLHPSLVEHAGLIPALRQLATEVGTSLGLRVTLVAPERPLPLKLDRGLAAYRIAQEALRNVARHSGSGEAAMAIRVLDGHAVLEIRDRGRGFEPGAGRELPGIGMVGMQERAALAGGYFRVVSEPGRGTVVEAAFPLTEA